VPYKVVTLKELPTKEVDCDPCLGRLCPTCDGTGKVRVFDRDKMTLTEQRRADKQEQVNRRRLAEDRLAQQRDLEWRL